MVEKTAVQIGDTLVLGLEASCDETAAAVVARSASGQGRILSNVVRSQFDMHREFGGVVPEIAARAHGECLDILIAEALALAGVTLGQLDAIAATAGPGLVGGLIVATVTAKALALSTGKPFLAINHLEGHVLTAGLTDGLRPPYLMLLVSGGHTQTLLVECAGRYRRIGTTVDDALGEAFDKTAKLLGLGFPGGPAVERAALAGTVGRFKLPRPMIGRDAPHFSFAGLKTAVRHAAFAANPLTAETISDLCADFQQAVVETLCDRVARAMILAVPMMPQDAPRWLVVAGGVAANRRLRAGLEATVGQHGYRLLVPPPQLCTDNGAMIAWAGAERLALGLTDSFDTGVRPRWPLDPDAPPAIGAGVKA